MEGDFFIGTSLATTLTKLALRFIHQVPNQQSQNHFCAEAMLLIAAILHLGRSGLPQKAISNDDAERLGLCLKVKPLVIRFVAKTLILFSARSWLSGRQS